MTRRASRILFLFVIGLFGVGVAQASALQGEAASASSPAAGQDADDDAVLVPAEPEYRLINVPTTMLLPRHRASFDLTHRFAGNLARGSFGEHAGSLFGLDQGALIGLELRFAPVRRVHAAVYRTTLEKTFQFHGKYDAVRQGDATAVSISALISIEGTDNFTEQHAPALGAVVSRTMGESLALYAAPIWVHNTAAQFGGKRDTAFVGLGGRARLRPTVYIVGEVSPRIGGYAPGRLEFGFGVEKRAGGHMFQLNVTNTFATTYGQTARGGFSNTVYLGFNLARKFF